MRLFSFGQITPLKTLQLLMILDIMKLSNKGKGEVKFHC